MSTEESKETDPDTEAATQAPPQEARAMKIMRKLCAPDPGGVS